MDEWQGAIVVGIDGSNESRLAVEWALDEAERVPADVHLLHVASDYAYTDLVDSVMRDDFEAAAQAVVEQARADAAERPGIALSSGWMWGTPAKVLADASATARMIAVGTRGHGRFMAGPLGSVSQHVARHASCPVAVVQPAGHPGARVIVGLDPAAPDPALRVGFEEAASRGLPLAVVRAWQVPALAGSGLGVPARGYDPDDMERAAHGSVRELVDEWAGKFPDVHVDIAVTRGSPSHVLAEASRGADLLVVGSRGRGWFTGMLLGSTSAAVAAHAQCTVLIAR